MQVRLGLGAWSNRHFDLALYPIGTPHAEHLPRYAAVFDVVEADVLYHRPPDPEQLAAWAGQVPDGFRFLPKMSKRVAQGPWDDGALAAAEAFQDATRALGDRHGPSLVQFPATFHRTTETAAWLERLLGVLQGKVSVEFRHPSWYVPETRSLLEDHRAALVWNTTPTPAPAWTTTDWGHVRFVGTVGMQRGRWVHRRDNTEQLLEMRSRLADVAKRRAWREAFVIVTNRFEGNAIDSLPTVAAALGRRDLAEGPLRRQPGQPLLHRAPGQTGLDGF